VILKTLDVTIQFDADKKEGKNVEKKSRKSKKFISESEEEEKTFFFPPEN
jgi:hypothetical protein